MAIRLKTIEYWFTELETLSDLTDTNFSQITVFIPESSVTFKSVTTDIIIQDGAATVANINRRQSSIQLGSAGYSAIDNTNLVTSSGENKWVDHTANFTTYFSTNWSGTSMTCDARILVDSSGTSIWKSATAKLTITYTYDDTSTTHIKTVRMPLSAPTTQMATTQGSAIDTIPALDTWLPENSVDIKQTTIIIQGNEESSGTTDMTLSMRIDTDTTRVTQTHEKGSNASNWYRHVWKPSFATNSTHDFYLWASVTDFDHPQVWMVITYEYDDSATSTVLNSVILPMEFESPMGGPTSADYQRATRDLWIQEPETITLQRSALFIHWDQAAPISGINIRVGTGSFSAFTSIASMVAGGCGAMLRCENEITSLVRGRNTLQADIYRTDTVDLGWNVSSLWMINYTSTKHANGTGAHNHSICWNLFAQDTSDANNDRITPAVTIDLPETERFITSIGVNYKYLTSASSNAGGVVIQVERLVAEGGNKWDTIYSDTSHSDPEQGIRQIWGTARSIFKRWPNDPDSDRLSLTSSARRYALYLTLGANSWGNLDMWITYHSIYYTVLGYLVGWNGDGSGYHIKVWRSGVSSGWEIVEEITTDVEGSWTCLWYDNTDRIIVTAAKPYPERGALSASYDLIE